MVAAGFDEIRVRYGTHLVAALIAALGEWGTRALPAVSPGRDSLLPTTLPRLVSIMGAKCLCWPFMNREDHSCLQRDLLLFLGCAFVSLLLLSSFSFL